MQRRGMSLTYKLLGIMLVLTLVPTFLVSISSVSQYQDMRDNVFDSIDDIRQISVDESTMAKTTAINRTKETMLDVVTRNLKTTRDDKIDKYSRALSSIEKQSEIVARYVEANWDYLGTDGYAPAFDGMVWAGPTNTDEQRQEYSDQIAKLSRVGVLLEQMDQGEPLTSLTYFGTRDNNVVTSKNITETLEGIPSGFSSVERPWYVRVEATNRTVWTNTYVDANTHNLVTTVASPVYRDGELFGAVGFDVTLGALSNDILETEPGFAFLLDQEGEAIVFPGMKATNKTVYAERTFRGRNLVEGNVSDDLQEVAQSMVDGEEGIAQVTIEGRDSYVAYGPLTVNDWSVGVAIPVNETIGPLNSLEQDLDNRLSSMGQQIGIKTDAVKENVDARIRGAMFRYTVLLVLLSIVVIGSGMYFSTRITKPIITLQEKAEAISKGGIGDEVDINTGDEIEELADSFNRVIRTIKILQGRDAPTADIQQDTGTEEL